MTVLSFFFEVINFFFDKKFKDSSYNSTLHCLSTHVMQHTFAL